MKSCSIDDLNFQKVCFSYDDKLNTKKILNNFSYKIKKGKFTSIIGPSGSGKTSLLKLISGIKINNLEDIPTFIDIHQEWHKFTNFKEKWSKVYAQQTMNVPKNYVYPIIGNKQIHTISRKELTACINNVYEKGINETARKMRGN